MFLPHVLPNTGDSPKLSKRLRPAWAKDQDPWMTWMAALWVKQGHAARSDPAPFHLFSSMSFLTFATLPGFCELRKLTWLANSLVFAGFWCRFHEFTMVETVNFGSPLFQKTELFVFFHVQAFANLPSSFRRRAQRSMWEVTSEGAHSVASRACEKLLQKACTA